ncbi:MAG: bifunctional adenosylcobinamide kinase/adenosylcobinamide-phosphate guanylyltransferase [Oscillospiraceae bacterium]|jgi:adenosylcobinamide kinase/adenosylcobinamide-phosphate guanylyltransferase|nr:bifunctional adenosylcobinamide kinase/adenosylcobinamide-phosphate guanylyltransferase [Oscillospiraceae bacterium]
MTVLLTGGSANGKSTFAERLLAALPQPQYYLFAMKPYGDGANAKIARHQEMRRGKGFIELERYSDVGGAPVAPGSSVLLECLCNLTANEMYDDVGNEREVFGKLYADVSRLRGACGNLVVVTNDVGSDCGGYDASTLRYVETLGRLNSALAADFDRVYELVAGIAVRLK